jgi:ribosomal protein L37AE/L43A
MKCPFCPSRAITRLSAMHDIYACRACGGSFTGGEAWRAYYSGGMSVGAMVAIVVGGVGLLVAASWYFQM